MRMVLPFRSVERVVYSTWSAGPRPTPCAICLATTRSLDDADRLHPDRIPKWFAVPFPPAHNRVTTDERSRFRPTLQFAPNDDARVEHLTHGLHVPGVNGREDA